MSKKQGRFLVVGVANTIIDFCVFWIAVQSGLAPVVANYISTTIALCFSFVVNRNYTFQTSGKINFRELLLFISVTLFGLWVIQPLVIKFTLTPFDEIISQTNIAILTAKAMATIVSLVWNYFLYDRVVFRSKKLI